MLAPTNKTNGIYLALITAAISGVSIFLNKYAVAAIKPPLYFTTAKNIGVGLIILGVLILTGKWKLLKNLSRREIIYLLLVGVVGGSLPFYLYFTGLSLIPAINAAIIHKTLALWVAILAIPLLKEKLTKTQAVAALMLFASNFIIGGFNGFQWSRGEFFVLTATLLWAMENILAKKVLPTVHPDIVVAARMVIGAIILLVAAAITIPQSLGQTIHLNAAQWSWLLLTIVLLMGYVMSWYRALKLTSAITVTVVLISSTLITNILSAIFVTHTLTALMAIQSAVVLAGLGLLLFATKKSLTETLTTTTTI